MQTVSGSHWRKRLSRHTAVKFPFAALSAKAQPSTSVCRNQTANNCARNRARYRWQLKSAITSPNFALWCNGNTAPFGGVILGSNPSGAATQEKTQFYSQTAHKTAHNGAMGLDRLRARRQVKCSTPYEDEVSLPRRRIDSCDLCVRAHRRNARRM